MPLSKRRREALLIWTITVRLPRDVANPGRFVARMLKHLLRVWGVRCVAIRDDPPKEESCR